MPLVGKLGSAHDGEIVAAARAIGRLLERSGLSFNDLARALEARPSARDPERDQWRMMAEFCARRDELLSEKEADFVDNMLRVLRRSGSEPTPRQQKWLRDIFDRLAEGVT